MKKLVSIVIPCYRSETMIAGVVADIDREMEKLEDRYAYEIILVNDCSPDGTFEAIRRLCQEKPYITGVNLARNFGQHAALMAGFRQMKGELLVCLDDDGQTPAAAIGSLLQGTGCSALCWGSRRICIFPAFSRRSGSSWMRCCVTRTPFLM